MGGGKNINVRIVYYHYYSFVGIHHISSKFHGGAKLIYLLSFSQVVAASKKLNEFPGLRDSAWSRAFKVILTAFLCASSLIGVSRSRVYDDEFGASVRKLLNTRRTCQVKRSFRAHTRPIQNPQSYYILHHKNSVLSYVKVKCKELFNFKTCLLSKLTVDTNNEVL